MSHHRRYWRKSFRLNYLFAYFVKLTIGKISIASGASRGRRLGGENNSSRCYFSDDKKEWKSKDKILRHQFGIQQFRQFSNFKCILKIAKNWNATLL